MIAVKIGVITGEIDSIGSNLNNKTITFLYFWISGGFSSNNAHYYLY